VAAWFTGVSSSEIYLSALTVGEIRKGIEKIRHRDASAAEPLEAWLRELVSSHSDRILGIDQEVAEQWGRFNALTPLAVIDSLLAATARVHRLTLVTRNLADVRRTGVDCLNPFSAASS
jgi:predicted nucleic acid-binding protein